MTGPRDPRLDRLAELLRGLAPDRQDDALEWLEGEMNDQDPDDQEQDHDDQDRRHDP